jgi:hypothetical protein
MRNNKDIHCVRVYFKNNNNIINLNSGSKEEALKVVGLLNATDKSYISKDGDGNVVIFIKTNDVAAALYEIL